MQKLDIIYLAFNLKIRSGICFSFVVSCVLVVGKGWKKRSQHVKQLRQRGGSSRKSYINLKWSRKDKSEVHSQSSFDRVYNHRQN